MNSLDQRIAIAEANGHAWTAEDKLQTDCASWHEYADRYGMEFIDDELPDYLNDLNAMHEVEKSLPVLYRNCYIDNLVILIFGEQAQVDGSYKEQWATLNATATQRAEAYLRTIGKWKD